MPETNAPTEGRSLFTAAESEPVTLKSKWYMVIEFSSDAETPEEAAREMFAQIEDLDFDPCVQVLDSAHQHVGYYDKWDVDAEAEEE